MRHLRPLQFPLLATCVILALGCQFSVGTACPEERMWNAERPSKRLYRLFNSSWHGRTRTGLICLRHSQPYIIKGTRDVSSSSCNIITTTLGAPRLDGGRGGRFLSSSQLTNLWPGWQSSQRYLRTSEESRCQRREECRSISGTATCFYL